MVGVGGPVYIANVRIHMGGAMEIGAFCALALEEIPDHEDAINAWRTWYEAQHEMAGDSWAPLVRDLPVWRGQLAPWVQPHLIS